MTRLKKIAIDIDPSSKLANIAKDLRSKIAEISLKERGFRPDAMFYCLSALKYFKEKTKKEINMITLEIALKGRQGLEVNDPEKKYEINSMKGSFSGLHLFSYLYVGFKIIDPSVDLGLDISNEYEQALKLFEQEKTSGYTIH